MPWTCHTCTFINNKENLSCCEICETKRAEFKQKSRTKVQATLFGGVIAQKNPRKRPKVVKRQPNARKNTSEWSPSPFVSKEPLLVLQQRAVVLLKSVFHLESLRDLQPSAVECALRRQSQIVVMATGGGKSLCYQLPALTLGGTTIVVSPLIALMVDQVTSLQAKKIPAAVISSSRTERQNLNVMERLLGRRLGGNQSAATLTPIPLLYVTPEQVKTERFRDALVELHTKQRLAMFAIDECHVISNWGNDFRPAYRELVWLRQRFPDVPCMACTATATPAVLDDIRRVLLLEDRPLHLSSGNRANIYYKVQYKDTLDSLTTRGSVGHLCEFVERVHKQRESSPCNGIVYVHKRDDTLDLSRLIRRDTGIEVRPYHGGMNAEERAQVQDLWMSGRVPIVIATVAFGMGINLPHVRYVVHWNLPKTLSGFAQESGRAGRDGLPAFSVLYYSHEDANRFKFLIEKQEYKKDGYQKKQRALDALEEMVDYCVKASCRRCAILAHFGQANLNPKTICEGTCDYCKDPKKVQRAAVVANEASFQTRRAQEKPLDCQWGKVRGDTNHTLIETAISSDWEVDGLMVSGRAPELERSVPSLEPKSLNMPKAAFQRASVILAQLEAAESKVEGNGGLKPTIQKKRTKVIIPGHIAAGGFKPASSFVDIGPCSKSSSPRKTSRQLKDEVDAMQKQLDEARRKNEVVRNVAAPPTTSSVPSPLTFSDKQR